MQLLWVDGALTADTRVALRGTFEVVDVAAAVEVRLLGASWFTAWVDGIEVLEGPDRFAHSEPRYQVVPVDLEAGEHVIAVEVHHHGVPTQHLRPIDPFLWCEVVDSHGTALEVTWLAQLLTDNVRAVRRLNPNLGWVDWRDARLGLGEWTGLAFDDGPWAPAVQVGRIGLGRPGPPTAASVRQIEVSPMLIGEGAYANRHTTLIDDPPLTVARRDLEPVELQPEGRWFRFDLGAVHLGRPRVMLEVPPGTSVELVYGEALHDGRVLPWISCSNGPAANMDHYLAHGGGETLGPSEPRGMRFFEVHVKAAIDEVRLGSVGFVERTYFAEPEGTFACADERLETIWATGLRTLRSCAEDAITDCPTRERGQWVGDAAVGLETASVGWSDLRLVPRALRHAAACANGDGLVSGNAPGGFDFHLTSFSCIWASTVWRCFRHTGDRDLLSDLLPAARRNIAAIAAHLGPDGIDRDVPWAFIDWGYVSNEGPSDTALNLLFVACLEDCGRWADALGEGDGEEWRSMATDLRKVVEAAVAGCAWEEIGYHVTALSLRLGLVAAGEEHAAVASMKEHWLRCFPNDPTAPQLGTPEMNNRRLVTPYFSHWAFPPLIERGETDFVIDQWKRCWGWMLDRGHRTFLEVFDERWSHSHQWSAGPSWQLSRYLLGLHPRYDLGDRTFDLMHRPGSLVSASGRLPAIGGSIDVEWSAPAWRIEVERPVTLRLEDGSMVEVAHTWERSDS